MQILDKAIAVAIKKINCFTATPEAGAHRFMGPREGTLHYSERSFTRSPRFARKDFEINLTAILLIVNVMGSQMRYGHLEL